MASNVDVIDNILKENILKNISFISDPSKINISLNDLKYIPELTKVISFEKIISLKEITLNQIHKEKWPQLIYIFLNKYNFIQKFSGKKYFDYTKMLGFWDLEHYKNIFKIGDKEKEPDIKMITNDEEHKFYLWDNISDNDKIYIGYMFFSAYNKIKNDQSINEKEYTYFTDINFQMGDYGIIENFKFFFLKQFKNFISTSNGSFFGDFSFGSNLKNMIQTKYKTENLSKLEMDISGFINDISLLYDNALKLNFVDIKTIDDYSIKVIVNVNLNEEILQFEIIKN